MIFVLDILQILSFDMFYVKPFVSTVYISMFVLTESKKHNFVHFPLFYFMRTLQNMCLVILWNVGFNMQATIRHLIELADIILSNARFLYTILKHACLSKVLYLIKRPTTKRPTITGSF